MSLIAPVKPFFKYSMDLKTPVPIVAYYCQLYGVQKGLEIVKNDTSGQDTSAIKKFLMGEMQNLETMKKALPEGSTKEDHRYAVENFVTSAFTNADKDERTCETITKKNAKDFNTCSHFIMLLSVFGDAYDEGDWEEKRSYCVFKAGSIMKALKTGEQPPRGNPNDPNNDGKREVPKPKEEEAKLPDGGPQLPNLDDMEAELARLEAGGIGGSGPSNPGATMPDPIMPPPMGLTDNMMMNNFDPNMNMMGGGPMGMPTMQEKQSPIMPPSQPQQIPQYQPQQPVMPPVMPQVMPQSTGATASSVGGKSMQYFMDLAECEKHIKHCQSEIDMNNAQGATGFIQKAVVTFQKHCGPQGKMIQLAPYQSKGNQQFNFGQRQQDFAQCKKLCKFAISEVDFNNVDAAISWLNQANQILMKY